MKDSDSLIMLFTQPTFFDREKPIKMNESEKVTKITETDTIG